jgi:hypothetical protein
MMEVIEEVPVLNPDRFICQRIADAPSYPTLIFICGIHGNEPMSVLAMEQVYQEIERKKIRIKGSLIAIRGNIKALTKEERYIENDLNRIWIKKYLKELSSGIELQNEKKEMKEILAILKVHLRSKKQEEVVVFDLHTTSSDSLPFITINDTISNRKIANKYPLATVFGIEEFLRGPLLSYINELGFNAIGFEGGQHEALGSFENHKAFIWLSLANEGLVDPMLEQVKAAHQRLKEISKDAHKFFEITYRYEVKNGDRFTMKAGFLNFQPIKKNIILASNNGKEIISKWNNRIFMPLYQSKGDDGFFIVRRIPYFFLLLSQILRKYNFEALLVLLPGVEIYDKKKHILLVNNKIARLLRNEIFHLFGFRQRIEHGKDQSLYIRREKQ